MSHVHYSLSIAQLFLSKPDTNAIISFEKPIKLRNFHNKYAYMNDIHQIKQKEITTNTQTIFKFTLYVGNKL